MHEDERATGELNENRQPKAFISRAEFASGSCTAPAIDLDRFRDDLDAMLEPEMYNPYAK